MSFSKAYICCFLKVFSRKLDFQQSCVEYYCSHDSSLFVKCLISAGFVDRDASHLIPYSVHTVPGEVVTVVLPPFQGSAT